MVRSSAGVYLLVRTEWLFALTPDVLLIVAWVGAGTALLAAILACAQDDIKRVLAYSTVSQLGYMMTAIGAGFATAGFFHLLTHGLFKALLFLGAGAVIHAVHSNDLPQMGGLARRMPQTAIVFLVGTLSLAGIPLFGGFLSKEEILGAVWRRLSVEERRHPLDWIDLNVGGPVVQPTIDGDFLEGDRKRGVLAVVGSRRGGRPVTTDSDRQANGQRISLGIMWRLSPLSPLPASRRTARPLPGTRPERRKRQRPDRRPRYRSGSA